ncbi:MAG: MOSC domain-containing protein [Spirulinaceae cyanobacterium RM2_2_10]|nr:MOSC domain-containing protein [Spirulinaceae cyanobacterium RM2_2_10]
MILERGLGVVGDRHARPGSPRQVLLVGDRALSEFKLQPGDLRENILLPGDLTPFASGQVWQLGATARLRLMFHCEPCQVLNRLRPGLATQIGRQRGWLAMVISSGTVQVGDRLSRCPPQFPSLSDRGADRFAEFVARIPPGRIIRTPALLIALGLSAAYHRVIPTYLKQARPTLPRHRLIRADGRLFERYIAEQAACLQAEGVLAIAGRLSTMQYDWSPAAFHALDADPSQIASTGSPASSPGQTVYN